MEKLYVTVNYSIFHSQHPEVKVSVMSRMEVA